MNAPPRRKLLEKRELSMPRTLEPYQMIERSIIKKYRDELWKPFVYAVKKYELIQAGDKIAVCISGGKDSMLMAKLMQELHRHSDVPFELVFLVMDPGYNTINRHISKMVYTKVVTNKSPWLQQATLGATYCNPASHGEGRFVAPKEWLDKLFANGQVATQYVNEAGEPTMDEEWNVNGSYMAIEGITSPDGRVLGKMAHSERRGEAVAMNIYGEQDMKIFESGVAYFK